MNQPNQPEWELGFRIRFVQKALGKKDTGVIHCAPEYIIEYIETLLSQERERIRGEVGKLGTVETDEGMEFVRVKVSDVLRILEEK